MDESGNVKLTFGGGAKDPSYVIYCVIYLMQWPLEAEIPGSGRGGPGIGNCSSFVLIIMNHQNN